MNEPKPSNDPVQSLASYLGDMHSPLATIHRQIKRGLPDAGGVEAVDQIRRQLKAFDVAAQARQTKIGSIADTDLGLIHLGKLLRAEMSDQTRAEATSVAENAENHLRQYLGIAFEVDSGNTYIELNL